MIETATESRTNVAEYSVSEISSAMKRTVEDAFGNVRVRGEISGYRGQHSSGHAYFSLKDDRSRIEAVVWKGTMSRLKFYPEDGIEVIVSGKLTTYPSSSKYQIVIDNLEPAGAGALMALLEERKLRLAAEGLFDNRHKRLLPFMPMIIGVATSPTGAVIHDIIHRIKNRFPIHVIVWPVRVQGETSGAEVANAVNGFNELPTKGSLRRPDLLIVARGGGSLEDLCGFNDEALIRAVAASHIPVISAVGHETDWTLIDLVSDMRAPTPTGAAELAVPVKAELEANLANLGARLYGTVSRVLNRRSQAVRAAVRALPMFDQLLALPRRRFDEATSRLGRAMIVATERKCARLSTVRLSPATLSRRINETRRRIDRNMLHADAALRAMVREKRVRFDRTQGRLSVEPIARHQDLMRQRLIAFERRATQAVDLRFERARSKLSQAERLMTIMSHKAVLARGFALVRDTYGAVLKRAADFAAGAVLSIEFADGTANAIATSGEERSCKPVTKPASQVKEPGRQDSLF